MREFLAMFQDLKLNVTIKPNNEEALKFQHVNYNSTERLLRNTKIFEK